MTSPAFVLLSLAFVCTITVTTTEQIADHDINPSTVMEYDARNISNIDKRRTKVLKSRIYTETDENDIDIVKYDSIYTEEINTDSYDNENIVNKYSDGRKMSLRGPDSEKRTRIFEEKRNKVKKRVKRYDDDGRCEYFNFNDKDPAPSIWHPHEQNSKTYYNNSYCVTIINATEGSVIELEFVDVFHIEYHPECAYDYLEIRDGLRGYAELLGKRLCGQIFPQKIVTSGPHAWLKFSSDDTIEYEGFHINVIFKTQASHSIPESCHQTITGTHGFIESAKIDPNCISGSANHPLDVLWTITTEPNTKIYLNFTSYNLASPNECEENHIQVFGAVTELGSKLAHYCGSVANSVSTKGEGSDPGNTMNIRFYATKIAKEKSTFKATFTAYRTLNPSSDDKCSDATEFDCGDNTCIDKKLKCDGIAHCRLKGDEDPESCKNETESIISQPHILVILVIFSLILSGMSFVFLFKCIRKLYQDHKIIKEHLRQSCEDRLDSLVGSRLILDAKKLQRDSEPRASLERENHTNEMFKQQRRFSKHKASSIDSDYIQETEIDLDEEPWRREVDSVPVATEDIRIERNGRTRRSDMSRKEESIRSKRKQSEEVKEKKEIRDVSVGAPDTKESSCQTRESLFQTDPPPSSDGSGTNSRGFSTFGYSGATIARPSPPAQTKTSEVTIELLKQVPRQESKPHKRISERRPISTETTRSAPDVIIVSKPIR